MPESLPNKKDFIQISEASKLLKVSIDTIRRWDKAGKLTSYRLDGKNRYFSKEELIKVKNAKPLSISETAKKLGVSTSTLRRLDKKGHIQPVRNTRGEREYSPITISEFQKMKKSGVKKLQAGVVPPTNLPIITSVKTAPSTFEEENHTVAPVVLAKAPILSDLKDTILQEEVSVYQPSASNPYPHLKRLPLAGFFKEKQLNDIFPGQIFAGNLIKNLSFNPALLRESFDIGPKARVMGIGFVAILLFVGTVSAGSFALKSFRGNPTADVLSQKGEAVLAESTKKVTGNIGFNIPALFGDNVEFEKNILVDQNASISGTLTVQGRLILPGNISITEGNINVNSGSVFANNILYGVKAGDGVTIGTGQTPTITNTGVLSLQGSTGAVTLTAGTGISISGTTISASDTGSSQNIFKKIVAAGSTITAGSNSDTLTFAEGSGITLATDTTSKTITITAAGGTPTGWTDDGTVVRLTTASDQVGIGTSTPTGGFALDVIGAIRSSNGLTVAGGTVSFPAGSIDGASIANNSIDFAQIKDAMTLDANLAIGATGNNYSLNIDSGTFFIDTANNRIGLGTTTPLEALDLSGNATVAGNITFSGPRTIATRSLATLTLGDNNTGNILFSPGSGKQVQFFSSSTYFDSSGNLTIGNNLDANGTSNDIAGTLNLSGNTLTATNDLILNPSTGDVIFGDNDVINIGGNGSDVAYNAIGDTLAGANGAILNSDNDLYIEGNLEVDGQIRLGNVSYTFPGSDGTGGYVLTTDGSGTLAWQSAGGLQGVNHFDLNNGAISPKYSTVDLLIGGTTTTSAKFAFINNAGGTPVASVSGNISLAGVNRTIGATNSNSLTLGDSSTGHIIFAPAGTARMIVTTGGNVGIGTTTPTSNYILDVAGATRITSGLSVTGGSVDLPNGEIGNAELANSSLTITAGNGLGNGGAVSLGSSVSLSVALTTSSDTANQSSNSGLEVSASGLSLLRGCDDGYLLKWNDTTKVWACAQDIGGISSAVVNIQENDTTVTSTADTLDFAGNDFDLTESPAGEVNIALSANLGRFLSANGSIYAANTTQDFLLGGTSTASATFGFINIGAGSPTATISGNLALSVPTGNAPANTFDILNNGTLNIRQSAGGNAGLTSRLYVSNTGNIGVGTTSPAANLDVTSSTDTSFEVQTQSGAAFGPRFVLANNGTSGRTYTILSTGSSNTGGAGLLQFFDTTGNASRMTIDASGNVAIGNLTNPASRLVIKGAGASSATSSLNVTDSSNNSILFARNDGNVGIGTTAPLAKLDVQGVGSFSGNLVFSGARSITSDAMTTLTIGGSTTGNIVIDSGSSSITFSDPITAPTSSNTINNLVINSSGVITSGTWNGTAIGTQYGGTGQNFSATAQGSIPYFNGTGTMAALAPSTSGYVLSTNGAGQNPSWISPSALGTNYWDEGNGAVYPKIVDVHDLLIGGSSTASAKFAFINVLSGTPTASISGNIALNSTGSIQSTNNQTITIGGSTTGNILLSPLAGSGSTTINGTVLLGSATTGIQVTSAGAVSDIDGATVNVSDNLDVSGTLTAGTADAFTVDASGNVNLASGAEYRINSTSVLSATTLGSGVTTSSLTTVGALTSGSIASGFGSILTTNAIQGSNFTATGTTGFTGSGAGAGLTFSGSGNHDITASSGTLRIGDSTLIGTVTANAQTITGIGTAQFGSGNVSITGTTVGLTSDTDLLSLAANALTVNGTITATSTIQGTTVNGTTGINTGAAGGTQRIDSSGNLANIGTIDSTYLDATTNTVNLAASTALQFNSTTVINSSRQLLNIAGITTSLNPTAANTYALGTGTGDQFSTIYGQTIYQNGNQVCDTGGNCAGALNFWDRTNGAIYPKIVEVHDLLLGGSSTASAKFAFINVLSGTPTASVSAGVNGATYLTANGTLQTTANQSLILGSSTTGNVILNPNGYIGVGTATPIGKFTVQGAATGKALAILNETGDQNIIAASASGTTVFTLARSGDIQVAGGANIDTLSSGSLTIGGSNQTGLVLGRSGQSVSLAGSVQGYTLAGNITGSGTPNITGIGQVSGSTGVFSTSVTSPSYTGSGAVTLSSGGSAALTLDSASGTVALAAGDSLTIPGTLTVQTTGSSFTGTVTAGTVNATSAIQTGGTNRIDSSGNLSNIGTLSSTYLSTSTNVVNLAASTVLQMNGTQVVDASRNLTNIGTTQFNALTYTWPGSHGSNGYVLSNNGSGTLSWIDVNNQGYWDRSNGAVYPKIATVHDLLLGGTSTPSAKFAFLNVNSGTPTASISANSGNNAALLTGTGNLATTNMQTLTLGGSTTGNIVINSGSDSITFSDAITAPTSSNTINGLVINGSGVITTGTWNGTAIGTQYGGTGQNFSGTAQGSVPYFNGTGTMAALAPSTAGYVLTTNGAGQNPSWVDPAGVGTNYWDRANGVLSPKIAGVHDFLLGSSATSSAKIALININSGTPTASVSATSTGTGLVLAGDGTIQSLQNATLTLGGTSTGNIVIDPLNGSGTVRLTNLSTGVVYNTNGTLLSEAQLSSARGGTGADLSSSTQGSIPYFATTGVEASLAPGTAGYVLSTNGAGANPTWVNAAGLGTNYWDQNNGALNPKSTTVDFLLGGQSTASAKFAVLNMTAGTPTASVSATSTGAGIAIGGDGTIQSLQRGTLTIGGSTTGNIVINSGSDSITFSDAITAPTSSNTINGLVINGSGVITTGTWNGTAIGSQYGGTGANLSAATQGSIPYFSSTGVESALAPSTAGYVLSTNGAGQNPSWIDSAALGTNYWDRANGVISPKIAGVHDLLLGSSSTLSAKLAFINVNSGTPTASISANSGNNATVLTGAGNLATTNMQTLTLGGSTTGNIVIDSGASSISLSDNTSVTGTFVASGNINTSGGSILTGGTARIDSSGNLTNIGSITSTYLNASSSNVNLASSTNLQFNGTTVINSSRQLLNIAGITTSLNPTAANTYALGTGTGDQFSTIYGQSIYQNGNQVCDTGGNCAGALNFWDRTNGAIYPKIATVHDLLLGGTSTPSAKFGFINVNSGNPTATIGGNLSVVVPTGANPATELNIFNGGTFALQNSPGGNAGLATRLYLQTDGNIGVGTTTPGAPIEAVGAIRTSRSGTPGQQFEFVSDVTGLRVQGTSSDIAQKPLYIDNFMYDQGSDGFAAAGANQSIIFRIGTGASPSEKARIDNNGNLGVGTTAPGAKFEVNGASAGLTLSGTGTHTLAASSSHLTLGATGAGSDLTLNPADEIIFDDGRTSAINFSDSGNTTFTDGASTSIIGAINTAYSAATGGGGAGVWTLSSGKVYPGTISNQVGIGTTTGANIISSLYVTRNLASGALGKSVAIFNQTEAVDILAASASGTTKFSLSNSGNIGFAGGTSFLNTLASGATAARTYTFPDATGTVCLTTGNCAGSGTGVTSAIGGVANYIPKFTAAQNIENSSLYDNGNLGIGTTVPSEKLDVNGNASASGNMTLDSAGSFQTSRMRSLTLGGTTTGNITIDSGSSSITLADSTSVTGNLTASGTTGLTLSGAGAGITFSSSGNHDITASSGTLRLGAATLTGTITAGSQTISGIGTATYGTGNLNLTGTTIGLTTKTDLLTLSTTQLSVDGGLVLAGSVSNSTGSFVIDDTAAIGSATTGIQITTAGAISDLDGPVLINDVVELGSTSTGLQVLSTGVLSDIDGALSLNDDTNITGDLDVSGAINAGTGNSFAVNTSGTITSGTWNGTAVGAIYGGTGLTSYATGDIIYASGTNTLAKRSIGNDGQVLSVSGGVPVWSNSSSINFWQRNSSALAPDQITNDVLFGGIATTSAKFAFINNAGGTPIASFSAQSNNSALYITSDGTIQTTANIPLTIGGNSTGDITLSPIAGSGKVSSTGTLNLSSGKTYQINGTNVLSATTLGSGVTSSSLTSVGTIATGVWNGTAVGPVYGGTGLSSYTTGDLLYASGTNTLAKLAIGSTNQVLMVSGGVPTWTSTGAINFWQRNNGALAPDLITDDLLLGGTTTASAKFAFINNIGAGTPTASMSAGATGGLYFDATGKIASTARQSITIGDSTTTGNVFFNPAGNIGIGSTSTVPTNKVHVTGTVFATTGFALNGGQAITADSNNKLVISATNGVFTGGGNMAIAIDADNNSTTSYFSVQTNSPTLGSGTELLRINESGNLGIGTTAPSELLDVNGNASASGNLTLNAAGTIQTTKMQTLTLGGTNTGNIVINSGTDSITFSDAITAPTSSNTINGLVISSGTITSGTWNGTAIGSTYGGTGFSTYTTGDLIYASGANTLAKRSIGTDNQVLTVSGGVPVWTDTGAAGINFWDRSNGAVYPKIADVHDLLLGGTATTSAKFAFINVFSGTPTASIAAQSANKALFLKGDGTIQTTANIPLTIGGNSTGDITLSPIAGSGKVSSTGTLNLSSGKTYQINGTDVLSATTLGTGVTASSLTSVGTIATGVWQGTAVGTVYGGTGLSSYTTGDLLYASGANTLAKRSIGTDGQVLSVSGGVPVWSDTGAAGINFWDRSNGAVYPKIASVHDLLIGGISTASAKFGFINVNSGTPTATIAGNLALAVPTTGVTPATTLDIFNAGTFNLRGSIGGDAGATSRLYISNTGNVGLGTTSPTSGFVLDVAGGIRGTNGLTITSGSISLPTGSIANAALANSSIGLAGDSGSGSVSLGSTYTVNGTSAQGITTSQSGSTLTITGTNASATQKGVASFVSGNFSVSSGAVSIATGGVGATEIASTTVSAASYGGQSTGIATFTVDADGRLTTAATTTLSTGGITANTIDWSNIANSMTLDANLAISASGSNYSMNFDSNTLFIDTANNRIGIGTTTPEKELSINGEATISGALVFGGSVNPNIATRAFAQLTLGDTATGDILLTAGSNKQVRFFSSSTYINSSGDLILNGLLDINGSGTHDIAGTLNLSGNTLTSSGDLTINPTGGDVIFSNTATLNIGGSGSDVAYNVIGDTTTGADGSLLTSDNDLYIQGDLEVEGSIRLSNQTLTFPTGAGSNGQVLTTNGSGTLSWSSAGTNYWDQASGATYVGNLTSDVLIGGNASSSAKFGFINVNSGTATATVSGNLTLSSSTATIANTKMQNLTIGNSETGHVNLMQNGNVGIGTSTPSDKLAVAGNIQIGAQADNSPSFSLLTSAAGSMGGDSSINGIFSTAVYNGKVYASTKKTDASAIYRYDGGTTWTQVSDSTDGKIVSGDTANIDASVLIVYNGKLYAGSQTGANTGALYSYNGSAWTLESTKGTFGATSNVDGVDDMIVYHGRLFVSTQESGAAGLYRWDTTTTFTIINSAAGKMENADAATQIDGGVLAVYNGNLVWGTKTGANSGTIGFFTDSPIGTGTSPTLGYYRVGDLGEFGATTLVADVDSLAVYNGSLYVAINDGANTANIYRYQGSAIRSDETTTGTQTWEKMTGTTGRVDATNDATDVDSVILRTYNGRLYAGSTTGASTGAVYEFDPVAATWTKINSARGTFGSETNVDDVQSLLEFNGSLYIGTGESAAGGIYSWTKTLGNSYALKFDSGSSNYGAISFVAGQTNGGNENTGSFLLSHALLTTTGAYDVAEDYPTYDWSLTAGDLVEVDPDNEGSVRKATAAQGVVGIYSEKPGFRLSQSSSTFEGGKYIPVALAGRVPVKVASNSAAIKPGDYLMMSQEQGKATRATAGSYTVGKALETWNPGTDKDKVMVFIEKVFYNPVAFNDLGDLQIVPESTTSSHFVILDQNGSVITKKDAFSDITAANITTGKLSAEKIFGTTIDAHFGTFDEISAGKLNSSSLTLSEGLTTNEVITGSVKLGDLTLSTTDQGIAFMASTSAVFALDTHGNASFAGSLKAKEIKSDVGSFETLTVKNLLVENIITPNASSSALIDFGKQGIKTDFAEFDLLKINSDLTVLGTTTLNNVAIQDSLTIGANMKIGASSIDTINDTLELQSSAQAGVSIMGNLVTIDTQGNVKVSGNAHFAKDVDVEGVLSAKSISVMKADYLELSATEASSSATAATSSIQAGQTERRIYSDLVKSDSLIYITPIGDTDNQVIFLSQQVAGEYFTVKIKDISDKDIKFNFLIINNKERSALPNGSQN